MENCTQAHLELAMKFRRLIDEEKDDEAYAVRERLKAELGEDESSELLDFIEERLEEKSGASKPKAKPKGVLQPARRVSQSAEHWRCLSNYPAYEISSHGRVRSIDRARPNDWLKPRYRWFRGMCVSWVVLKDRDGRRCERMIGKLLIAAGFMPKPAWMETKPELSADI